MGMFPVRQRSCATQPSDPTPQPVLSEDEGFSLVEVLVATSLMMIVVVGIMGALSVALLSSHAERGTTTSHDLTRSYQDAITAAKTYVPCAAPGDYTPEDIGWSVPEGYAARVSAVAQWNGNVDPVGFSTPPSCTSATDSGMQQLTLEVTTTTPPTVTQNTTMIWRKP